MPSKIDNIAINNETLDRRRKLMAEDEENIRDLRKQGLSLREIARVFGVCHRTIQFVLDPEKRKAVNYPGHWKKYYDKKRNTIAMREHRHYKQTLVDKGLIGD